VVVNGGNLNQEAREKKEGSGSCARLPGTWRWAQIGRRRLDGDEIVDEVRQARGGEDDRGYDWERPRLDFLHR
jgi:hypothetical protein